MTKHTMRREVSAIIKPKKAHGLNRMLVTSHDNERTLDIVGEKIEAVPVWCRLPEFLGAILLLFILCSNIVTIQVPSIYYKLISSPIVWQDDMHISRVL